MFRKQLAGFDLIGFDTWCFLQEVDDLMIRRFLRARDLDVNKASAMFLKYLKWKHSFVPNGSISPSEIVDDIAQEKMYVQGVDKKGRPITIAFAAKHFQNKNGLDGFKRTFMFHHSTSQFSLLQFRVLFDKYFFFCI